MEENNKEEYISLLEAAKLCDYSEPYLRLRSRQGKLKSIKLGKKWMTKASWIKDYVNRAKAWNEKMEQKKQAFLQSQEEESNSNLSLPVEKELKEGLKLPMLPPSSEEAEFDKPERPVQVEKKETPSYKKDLDQESSHEFMRNFSSIQSDYALVLATGTLFAIMIFFGVALEKQLIFQDLDQASIDRTITKASLNEPTAVVSKERVSAIIDDSSVCGSELPCQEEKNISEEKSLLVKIALEVTDFLSQHPFPW